MVYAVKIEAVGVEEISQKILNIQPGQEISYYTSIGGRPLGLSIRESKVVRKDAYMVANSGRAMLFHRRVGKTSTFHHVVRGVEKSAKKIIEAATATLPHSIRWPEYG